MPLSLSWTTPAGIIGVYPANVAMQYNLTASVSGGSIVDYKLLSGGLSAGLFLRSDGRIYGTPSLVNNNTTSQFVVRVTATDGVNTIVKDRTFEITITGDNAPKITTVSGSLGVIPDSTWFELAISYTNPNPDNPIFIRVLEGTLPPGLEINESGLIRGYADKPVSPIELSSITITASATDVTNNTVTVTSTDDLVIGRSVVFSGIVFGNIIAGTIYYVKEIIDATSITLTTVPNGSTLSLTTASGIMTATFAAVTIGQPTKYQYNFTVELSSPFGNDLKSYSITVINQNLSPLEGNPFYVVPGARVPTLLNTRPLTYNIADDIANYGYYVLPPEGMFSVPGTTYPPSQEAYIGQFLNQNFFAFRILGKDFDDSNLTYVFSTLPGWLNTNTATGWMYGTPAILPNTVQFLSFDVKATKVLGSNIIETPWFNFNFKISSDISGVVSWTTDGDLGTVWNSETSMLSLAAISDVPLYYSLDSGSLPPNLTLATNGEIRGIVSYQPDDLYKNVGTQTEFQFVANAYAQNSSLSNVVYSTKTFTVTVDQKFENPTDNLYITCTPNKEDRQIISSLLSNSYLLPTSFLFRSDDINFGKARDVTYAHAYGIESSNLNEYLAAVQKNHYWRSVVLGELNTAIARDTDGNIMYEVVYSTIVDDLMKYDPEKNLDYRYATSISEEIYWPRFIDLFLGPWYTSSTSIFTSYIFAKDAYLIANFTQYDLLSQDFEQFVTGAQIPTYYTSLTPEYARTLYPNSLDNMRKRIEQELGVNDDFRKLPLWMTTQQLDGNTLGFTPAWVICYTKPAPIVTVTATQTIDSLDAVVLDTVDNIIAGGTIIFTGTTFGNIVNNQKYWVKTVGVPGYPTAVVLSFTKNGDPISVFSETGSMTGTYTIGSYATVIKERIETEWNYKLNQIDFKMDRFTVDKQLTYDYDNEYNIDTFTDYPSATPTPNPVNSENFYVLFPRKTILPTNGE